MREEEARCIAAMLLQLPIRQGATCLNIGSSTRHFRENMQPHITRELIAPLKAAGLSIIHCDIKPEDGVDLVGNVLEPAFQESMAERRADILLCCNLLEHLDSPDDFAAACANLVRPGGYMVVSIPYSYPYHEDPIDTMLRPSPESIATYFPDWQMIRGKVVVSNTYLHDLKKLANGPKMVLSHLASVFSPCPRHRPWWGKAHRLLWLFRPYKISIALLRKPSDQLVTR